MRWQHSHSWVAGILTGIIIDQRAIYLIALGAIVAVLFMKIGVVIRAIGRRWAIRL